MPQLIGPGLIGAAGPSSNFYTTPYPHKPGDKARDRDGNEYVFCDIILGPLYRGLLVQIDVNYGCQPLLNTARSSQRVGVWVGGDATSTGNPTSDNGGWVQIYGLHQAVQTGAASDGLSSDNTVEYFPSAQTSVGTPSGVLSLITVVAATSTVPSTTDRALIYGLWVVPNVATANIGAVSDIGVMQTVSAWPVSGASGPSSLDGDPGNTAAQGMLASGTNTSGFIGSTYVCYLNYPYVTGNADLYGAAGS